VRPLSWIVTAASIVALLLGARVLAGRRAHPVMPVPPDEPAPVAAATPHLSTRTAPSALRTHARRAQGLAHVRGRVVGPTGQLDAKSAKNLEVDASDGKNSYDALVSPDGTFELHLPARHYTLDAAGGGLVGEAELEAEPDAHQAVTITLTPPVSIEGTLHLPAGASAGDVQVRVFRAGTKLAANSTGGADEGRFFALGLVSGVAYDLTIEAEGLRPARLRAVTAPASGLVATLAPGPVLRGAIGFGPDGTCPLEELTLDYDGKGIPSDDQPEDDLSTDLHVDVDRNCTFAFEHLPDVPEVTLSGSNQGWHVEERVAIPPEGDPPPVCLNPPCRDLPPVGPTKLRVRLLDAPAETTFQATIELDNGGMICRSAHDQTCTLSVSTHAKEVELAVSSTECATARQSIQLHPGDNEAAIPCRRTRLVQGTVRASDGALARNAMIRCGDDGGWTIPTSYVFHLRCPADQTEIIYQSGRHGQTHRAPLAPGPDPVLLDLTL
jgi:hypothetical protein